MSNYLLRKYNSDKFFIKKKAKYTFFFTLLLFFASLTIMITDAFFTGFTWPKFFETATFLILFLLLFFLLQNRKLELCINLLMLSGFLRCGILFYYKQPVQYISMLFLIILALAITHVKKYQLFSGFIIAYTAFLTRLIYLYTHTINPTTKLCFSQLLYSFILFIIYSFLVFFLVEIINNEIEEAEILENVANTDLLTQLSNRRKLEFDLSKLIKLSDISFSMLLIDLDYFKQINDTYGHKIGDIILHEFAEYSRSIINSNNPIYRWGGEEFIIILKHSSKSESLKFAENYRLAIQKNTYSQNINLSVSIGVVTYSKNDDSDSLFKKADNALYIAKEKGRNLSIHYDDIK